MANQATTNLHGTVASDNTVANLITIARSDIVEIIVSGLGGFRYAKNSSVPNTTTDNSAPAGYPKVIASEPGVPITTVLVYANASESTLTYDVNIVRNSQASKPL